MLIKNYTVIICLSLFYSENQIADEGAKDLGQWLS